MISIRKIYPFVITSVLEHQFYAKDEFERSFLFENEDVSVHGRGKIKVGAEFNYILYKNNGMVGFKIRFEK